MMLIGERKSSYAVVKQDITNISFTCIVSLSQTEINMRILDLILDMIIVGDEEEDVK